jgi:hypothetical protein
VDGGRDKTKDGNSGSISPKNRRGCFRQVVEVSLVLQEVAGCPTI